MRRPLPDLRLIAVGRIGRGLEADLFARYAERLRPRLAVVEVPEGRGAPAEAKRRESEALLAALPAHGFAVALDLGGTAASSEALAASLAQWSERARSISFLIGGADGLETQVLTCADHVLSLGAMTWPHLLVRVMLAEQLYRAQAINAGHPYHRAGRP